MTRHETFDAIDISEKKLVLATDLDGTFLGGSDEQRSSLYSWIEANRAQVGLIFVTGRDPGIHSHSNPQSGRAAPRFRRG